MVNEKTFRLTIARVDKQLFNDEVFSVTLPGSDGQMTILAHHTPLISLLKEGIIRITESEGQKEFHVEKGICEISNNQVTVLV